MKHYSLKSWLITLLLIIAIIACEIRAFSQQTYPEGFVTGYTLIKGTLHCDSSFVLPFQKPTYNKFTRNDSTFTGAVYFERYGDKFIHYHNGTSWRTLLSSDTLGYYFAKQDSNTHGNAITYDYFYDNLPSSAGTVTSVATGYGLLGGIITTSGTLYCDTTLLIAYTDTSKYYGIITRTKLLAMGYGTGTVTSVATGYGLSGGTITGAGTIVADTATLFTQLLSTLHAGTNIDITNRIVSFTGTLPIANGGTNATTTTSINATPVTYGANTNLSTTYVLTVCTTPSSTIANATAETNLGVFAIAAGTLPSPAKLYVEAFYRFVGTGGTKLMPVRFTASSGSTSGYNIGTSGTVANTNLQGWSYCKVWLVTTSSQLAEQGAGALLGSINIVAYGSVNTAGAISYINFNITMGSSADSVQLMAFEVKYDRK